MTRPPRSNSKKNKISHASWTLRQDTNLANNYISKIVNCLTRVRPPYFTYGYLSVFESKIYLAARTLRLFRMKSIFVVSTSLLAILSCITLVDCCVEESFRDSPFYHHRIDFNSEHAEERNKQ